MKSKFEVKSIGYVESCYKDKFGVPRQSGLAPSSEGRVVLLPEVQPEQSLVGLEGFSHIWLLFWFHQNKVGRFHAKVHPPRLEGKSMGLFATRTPHRPNPIGLSVVKLEKIESPYLYISGIDMVDKTPVLDIKPYLPQQENVTEAFGGWVNDISREPIVVTFSEKAEGVLVNIKNPTLRSLIIETLQWDPRPLVYREDVGGNSAPYKTDHAIRLFNLDVHFRFIDSNSTLVFDILMMK